MRVAVLDMGDVPSELRRTVGDMFPPGWRFAEVLLPHRDAALVRQWANPTIIAILRSHGCHIRWFGSHGLHSDLRHRRDCADALKGVGIDEFDDFDDAFTVRTGLSTDRATMTRVLESVPMRRTARDAIYVRLRGCEDVRYVEAIPDAHDTAVIRDDVLSSASASHRIRRLRENRQHADKRASRAQLCESAQQCVSQQRGLLRRLIEAIDADRLLVYASGTVSLGAHNGTDSDPWDMAVVACVGGKHHSRSYAIATPVPLREVFRVFDESLGCTAVAPPLKPILSDDAVAIGHGSNFRHIIVLCRSVRLRVIQWVPYLFNNTHLQVFKHGTDAQCEVDLTLQPGWLSSPFAQALAAVLLTISDTPLQATGTSVRTSTELHALTRTHCVYTFEGMLPLAVLRACAEKEVMLRDTVANQHVQLSKQDGETVLDGRWRLVGPTEVDASRLTIRHRIAPVHMH